MRALQTHDIFVALRIANSAGVNDEFKKMALAVSSGKKINQEEIGLNFLINIICNCGDDKTERLIYDFLGGIMEIEPDTIRVMDPLELMNKLKELGEYISIEDWKAFFQSLSAVIAKQN